MSTFSISSCKNKGITFLDEMLDTIDNQLPILNIAWENLAPYTLNNRWRSNLDLNLEIIGTGHYTLLKSLNYIRKNKDLVKMNDPEQRLKNIYFHFGLIIDSIKQISRSILLFKSRIGIINFQEPKYSKDEIVHRAAKWYLENYESCYKNLVNNGVAIALPLQPESDYTAQLVPQKNLKVYNKFKNSIQPYRNVLIHNPAVDIFVIRGIKGQFVVKKEVIKKCRFLNQIDKAKRSDLTNPIEMVNRDYDECLIVIESIWGIVLKHIKEINDHPDFISKRDRK